MLRKVAILVLTGLVLQACTSTAPTPSIAATPAPTPTPTLTPTPAPTPTATLIPPLRLTILWPAQVSALEPIPIKVELIPPPGIDAPRNVRAVVFDPEMMHHDEFQLLPRDGNLYAADEMLQLPLEPAQGDWRLVVDVESDLDVRGEQIRVFQPLPTKFRAMTGILPTGIDMLMPEDFVEMTSLGDRIAGGRVWRHSGGEVAIWWAPGPIKPLLLNNAVVMAEAAYGVDSPAVTSTEEITWQGQTGFLFHEEWAGEGGGPGKTLVVQGPDYWLYIVRVRATGGEVIPPLLDQVWGTFAFVAE
jgi:hypothetical protein